MPSQESLPSIVTLAEIEEVVSSDQFAIRLIDAIKEGFASYSNGEFNSCPIQTMGAPPMASFSGESGYHNYEAQTCVKSGYVTGASHYVIKVASGGHPFPANSGLIQLYSQTTGRLEMILMDEGLLTELRTAAAGAAAAQILSPDLSSNSSIGILGTGVQARYQLQYLKHVTECRNVLVYGRTDQNVKRFMNEMTKEGWHVRAANSADELLDQCQLIVTTTPARDPVLGKDWTSDIKQTKGPLHITCIGSDAVGKVELGDELIASADLLVTDCRLQTKERGEFQHVIAREVVSLDSVVEIGELIQKRQMHRQLDPPGGADRRLTIFDSSGVAVQDCVVAKMVNKALQTSSRDE